MPSSRRLRITPEADDDLSSIARYSSAHWGPTHMASYIDRIYDALDDLTRFPGIGRTREEIAPGLRSYPIGQHVAFYRVTDDELIVVRIAHSRRDSRDVIDG